MSRRIVSSVTFTPTATADTTNLVDGTYANILQGGTGSQINVIWEISISGQASSSSSPTFMILGRDSTTAATNSLNSTNAQNDAAVNSEGTFGTLPLTGSTNTTKPQRSSTLHMQNCSLNAFGGNYFWRGNRMEEAPMLFGNAASVGEASLSAYTGGTVGAIGVHMIYEPF